MLAYFITFALSILFIRISESIKKYKVLKFIFILFAILIPCYLASQRDISIGADTKGYISGMFDLAVSSKSSLFRYLVIAPPWYAVPRTIVGYMSLTWICAQFDNGLQILLFCIELLSILPVYLAIKKASNNSHEVVFSYALYLFFSYNITLNAARQMIAIAFYMLAFVYMMQKKYKLTVLYSAIAFTFHDTVLLIIVIVLIKYIIVDRTKNIIFQKRFEHIIVAFSVIAVVGFYPLLGILVHSGIYSHGDIYLVQKRFDFSFIKTGLYLFVYIVIILNKKFLIRSRDDEFYRFIALLSVIWLQAGVIITYADRLSWYLFIPVINLYLPKIAFRESWKIGKKRWLYSVAIILVFIVFWIVLYGVINEHDTVPYMFYRG